MMKKASWASALRFGALASVAAAAMAIGTHDAEAATSYTGHICTTMFIPGSGGGGDYGYLYTTVYTGTACSGSYLGTAWFCSTGATTPSCDSSYLSSDVGINALYSNLSRSSDTNQKVNVYVANGSSKGQQVQFRAD